MEAMIRPAAGFSVSVNLAYDLGNEEKIKQYLPTAEGMAFLGDVLDSVRPEGEKRARILIGPYGKGKSQLVLMVLSVLAQKDLTLFEKMTPRLKTEFPAVYQKVQAFYRQGRPLLPVVVTGAGGSLVQAFALALERTLRAFDLSDVVPETSYQAARRMIARWQEDYPATYAAFAAKLGEPVAAFLRRLEDFDAAAYHTFETLYPTLTAGGVFRPLAEFDVVTLYQKTAHALAARGYAGLFVVCDEFSKYLERYAGDAAQSDTRMLQDFAEYAVRSGSEELHLLLISHKELTSYFGQADKKRVDGWRGVAERFVHVYLGSDFAQSYEIMAATIEKDEGKWRKFTAQHQEAFSALLALVASHPAFKELDEAGRRRVVLGCYPLAPFTTFLLPRISERVAQNERTLFTFLAGSGSGTLRDFLARRGEDFALLTPDGLYDYFAPLLRQEVYAGELHEQVLLTERILARLALDSLEARLVKSLTLITLLAQYELLRPTEADLLALYAGAVDAADIRAALRRLIEEKYVVYLKRSNGFLRLKETSGVDVAGKIRAQVEKRAAHFELLPVLASVHGDRYLYPKRYNEHFAMTRYFVCNFVTAEELTEDFGAAEPMQEADGTFFCVLAEEETEALCARMTALSERLPQAVFALARGTRELVPAAEEYEAATLLAEAARGDALLYEDYDLVAQDLAETLRTALAGFTHPEQGRAQYFCAGRRYRFRRRAELSGLLSSICERVYPHTPVIRNEVINCSHPTAMARRSRGKILAALLSEKLLPKLGFRGTGQEIFLLRTTLVNPGVLVAAEGEMRVTLAPSDERLRGVLRHIVSFLQGAREEPQGLAALYKALCGAGEGIGLRRGLVPLYLAAVLHVFLRQVVFYEEGAEVALRAETLEAVNRAPEKFSVRFLAWDEAQKAYLDVLAHAFAPTSTSPTFAEIAAAMRAWYLRLPKYTRGLRHRLDGSPLPREITGFLQALRQGGEDYVLLFEQLPRAFDEAAGQPLGVRVAQAKKALEQVLPRLKDWVSQEIQTCLSSGQGGKAQPLVAAIRSFVASLPAGVSGQVFPNGAQRLLALWQKASEESEVPDETAYLLTGLRLMDWEEDTAALFSRRLREVCETLTGFVPQVAAGDSAYTLSYENEQGERVTRTIPRATRSPRGKLLYRALHASLASMGQAVSEQEKRQILLDVLEELC